MDSDSLLHYLRIFHSDLLSITIFSRLLKEVGTVAGIRNLSEQSLREIGLSSDQSEILKSSSAGSTLEQRIETDLEWSAKPENFIVCYESEEYPKLLREIDTAPPLLYLTGHRSALAATQIAIVGSRKATIQGRRNAYWMAQELETEGLQISSGLALGVDTEAHRGVLDVNGSTLAVLGTGVDRIYPVANKKLSMQIVERGALVSEFPLGTAPYAYNFPRRNRIISGLCLGTLVVEANSKSGSLITARFAMEQNREVFAFPGPITSQQSRGCHRLIKQGAKLVEGPADILEELGIARNLESGSDSCIGTAKIPEKALSTTQRNVLMNIDHQGCLFESMLEESKLGIQELNKCLLELEIADHIHQEGGRYYRLG